MGGAGLAASIAGKLKVRSTIAGKLTPIMQSLVVYTGRVDVSLVWGDGMCNFRPLCRRSHILRLFQK